MHSVTTQILLGFCQQSAINCIMQILLGFYCQSAVNLCQQTLLGFCHQSVGIACQQVLSYFWWQFVNNVRYYRLCVKFVVFLPSVSISIIACSAQNPSLWVLLSGYLWRKNKRKITASHLFYNINTFPYKFYFNQTSITIKKEKNLIQEEPSFSKFCINVFQFEKENL